MYLTIISKILFYYNEKFKLIKLTNFDNDNPINLTLLSKILFYAKNKFK